MSALVRIPRTIEVASTRGGAEDAGGPAQVRRVWPDAETSAAAGAPARFVVEVEDAQGRVRAGTLRWRGPEEAPDLTLAPYGADDRLPALAPSSSGGRVIGHRLGKRAVVARPDRFVKTVRPRVTQRVVGAAERAARLDDVAGLRTPQVLASGPGQLDLSVLDGSSAHELGSGADLGTWYRWWAAWIQTWCRLVEQDPGTGVDTPRHGAEQEVGVLTHWVARATTDRVVAPEAVARAGADATAALLRVPGSGTAGRAPLVLAHRDLHDKQIFFSDGPDVGLLDFDTLAWAEPALDLANLAVHADLRQRQGVWSADHAGVVRSAVVACAAILDVPEHRLRAYARASTVRLACVYAYRPPWQDLAADLLRDPPALTGWPVRR